MYVKESLKVAHSINLAARLSFTLQIKADAIN
jgi:hypothetical protein